MCQSRRLLQMCYVVILALHQNERGKKSLWVGMGQILDFQIVYCRKTDCFLCH